MRRPAVVTALALGAFFFIGISLFLARGLSATSNERAEVVEVLEAQARGDAEAVLSHLPECKAVKACATSVRTRTPRLRRPGEVKVLNYDPSVQLAITEQRATARVAWRAGAGLPVVQCVRVLRRGAMQGAEVELISISPPIGRESPCL